MHTNFPYTSSRTRDTALLIGQVVSQWGKRALDAVVRLSALGMIEANARPECDAGATQVAEREARLLRQAVYLNSAVELDWLWYAGMMSDPAKHRFCLERALEINPANDLALGALAKLSAADRADRR